MRNIIFALLLVGTNFATYYLLSNHEAEPIVNPVVQSQAEVVTASPALPVEALVESNVGPTNNYVSLEELGNTVLNLKDSPLRAALLEVLTSGWFEQDHVGLAEWLNEQPYGVDADHALATFANLASEIDPEGSVDWAASVLAPGLREQALSRAAREYARMDPRGYKKFIDSNNPSARAILNLGLDAGYQESADKVAYRYDIIEDAPEPIASILARRTRLAGSSARENNVELTLD
jgi:hypothetical protein